MSTVILYLAVAAGVIAVVKLVSSSKGKVTIPGGLSIQWAK